MAANKVEQDPAFHEFLRVHFKLDEEVIYRFYPRWNRWERMDITPNSRGYSQVRLHWNGQSWRIMLHRLIWFLHQGVFPGALLEIDHIDRNPSNNRIENLRVVTSSENRVNCFSNQKKQRGLTSSYLGVSFSKRKGKFRSRIYRGGVGADIGHFTTEEEAARARDDYIIKNGLTDRYKLNFPQAT